MSKQPQPIYKPGDRVRITGASYYSNRIGVIQELSPGTQKRRGPDKQWRYKVIMTNGDLVYCAEKHLEKS